MLSGWNCVLGMAAAACLAARVVVSEMSCADIPTETNLRVEDIEGEWYPMEVVLHRNDSKINGVPLNTSCPVVTFSTAPKTRKVLIMLWNSTEGDLEYRFTMKGSRGQWQSTSSQSGVLSWLPSYRHYNGSMKIAKLENGLLVLHFCSKNEFPLSIVFLSRTGEMPTEFIQEYQNSVGFRRAAEIRIGPCQDDAGGGICVNPIWLLTSLLPSLGLWLTH